MNDIFKSVPAKDAVVRDLTKATLVLNVMNSLGEKFHFEIQPGEVDNLPTRASDTPFTQSRRSVSDRDVIVNMEMPFA